jgi:hypothetical protein
MGQRGGCPNRLNTRPDIIITSSWPEDFAWGGRLHRFSLSYYQVGNPEQKLSVTLPVMCCAVLC